MENIFGKFAVGYAQGNAPLKQTTAVVPRMCLVMHIVLWVMVMITLLGCSGPDNDSQHDAVLIRTDQQTITQAQFERAFEAARIAYSDDRSVDPQTIQNARLRLLNQMTEEVIVERRAKELGIVLDEPELAAAIQEIKKDFPENEFEQMLLESAIPYSLWKDRLRIRLLMEKVVDRELAQPLDITAQDIEQYYKIHEKELEAKGKNESESDINRQIVNQLRREKVETAYPGWMDGLRQRYGVEIDWELWEQSQQP